MSNSFEFVCLCYQETALYFNIEFDEKFKIVLFAAYVNNWKAFNLKVLC